MGCNIRDYDLEGGGKMTILETIFHGLLLLVGIRGLSIVVAAGIMLVIAIVWITRAELKRRNR